MSRPTHGGRVHVEPVMGTTVTLDIRDQDLSDHVLDTVLERGVARLHEADRVFSTWDEHSPLSRLRAGLCEPQHCPPEVLDVLARCGRAKQLTRGWFDPWAMPGGLDPTGLVKGWAAQRALNAMAATGVRHALVNAGGDIAVLGSALADDKRPGWNVAITNPHRPDELLTVTHLRWGGIATSGGYERGSLAIDPAPGGPSSAWPARPSSPTTSDSRTPAPPQPPLKDPQPLTGSTTSACTPCSSPSTAGSCALATGRTQPQFPGGHSLLSAT